MIRKPIILMDQDGPLADFDGQFHDLAEEWGVELHSTPETQCCRYATDCVVDPEARRRLREHIDTTPWFRSLPPVDGAIEGMRELAEYAEVWIVTKPLEVNPTCRDDKVDWVKRILGAEWERRVIIAPDKSLVNGDVLVDDGFKLEWLNRATWAPVVFTTPWNGEGSDWGGIEARWTWADGVDRLLEHAESMLRAESVLR